MCVPAGMLLMSCFFADVFLRATGFLLRSVAFFCFAFGFGLALLIPGMLWPSCWATTLWPIPNDETNKADKIKYLYCENIVLMILTSLDGAGVCQKETGKRPQAFTPG